MQKVIVIFKNLGDRNEITADNLRIEYAGQAIEFRDGQIRVETVEEPEPVFCTCHPYDRVYYGCRCKKQAKRENMPPVMHW